MNSLNGNNLGRKFYPGGNFLVVLAEDDQHLGGGEIAFTVAA